MRCEKAGEDNDRAEWVPPILRRGHWLIRIRRQMMCLPISLTCFFRSMNAILKQPCQSQLCSPKLAHSRTVRSQQQPYNFANMFLFLFGNIRLLSLLGLVIVATSLKFGEFSFRFSLHYFLNNCKLKTFLFRSALVWNRYLIKNYQLFF